MTTKHTDLVAKLTAAGWATRPDAVIVWHSNGDDQLILASTAHGWEGQWLYPGYVETPVGPTLAFADDDAVLAHLAIMDPTCVRCGYQGHSSDECDEPPAPGFVPADGGTR